MMDLPCDFQRYLEQRFGKSPRATLDMLGDWLQSYEPEQPSLRAREPLLAKCASSDDVTFAA
jgi:hypothetical protein